ncbi:MAG: hypothetical protein RLZZ297_1990 [Chloroflexota bacterium]|jgi:nitrite reductase/ring-hydroxylating ferredoxin subunit
MAMAVERVALIALSAVKPGTLHYLDIDGLPIGVAHAGGTVYAFGDTCRHEGGSLSSGVLVDTTVTCPWHGWTYELRTGKAVVPPVAIRIPVYPTVVQDGIIYADIDWGE